MSADWYLKAIAAGRGDRGVLIMPKRKSKSSRADGRGGWVRGRRRNEDRGDWQAIRIALVALLDEHPLAGVRSARAIAEAVGVSDASVRRWLRGEDRPAPEYQELLRVWAGEQREAVKAEGRRTQAGRTGPQACPIDRRGRDVPGRS